MRKCNTRSHTELGSQAFRRQWYFFLRHRRVEHCQAYLKDEKYATGITPCMTHPHNFYVQLLAETGIIGFLFLFSALVYVVYTALRQFKSIILKEKRPLSDYQVCLLAGILITVWPLTTNGNFFNNWLMIVYSLPVGFYLQSIYSKKKVKKD